MNAKAHRPIALWFVRSISKPRLPVLLILAIALVWFSVSRIRNAVATTSPHTSAIVIEQARMSDEISVHAAGRGTPWINLSDGHELITPYSGPRELTQALERNEAQPSSLCSADFDEDGVPDLISGYATTTGGGIVTFLRGNVDSIYPNAPEAKQRKAEGTFTDAPFLSPAFVFSAPEAADFIGAGDFDGDGHWDVVTAARGSIKLYLMSGDGKGELRQTIRVELSGGVTAMAVGEINRRDGLDDVAVGVSDVKGSRLLVFEGPQGALRASPETFDLPAQATSLALGQMDDSYEMDLAIASGHELMIVHGRDRKLSLDAKRQAEVRQAQISRRTFSSDLKSLTLGDFAGSHKPEIAVLSGDGSVSLLSAAKSQSEIHGANRRLILVKTKVMVRGLSGAASLACTRSSSLPIDNLLVVDPKDHRLRIFTYEDGTRDDERAESVYAQLDMNGIPAAVLPMRLNADALNDLVILEAGRDWTTVAITQSQAIFIVNNTNDGGLGSLRQAILDANANPGADTITFSIAGSGVPTIKPLSALPPVIEPVTIDGTTQSAGRVELDGSGAGISVVGLSVTAGSTRIRGLVINRFSSNGVRLFTNGSNIIEGNLIGTDVTGEIALGNSVPGLAIGNGANENIIGGPNSAARNLISANGDNGISIFNGSSRNLVIGNYVGTDMSARANLGNFANGVVIFQSCLNNTIGGISATMRNVISGNGRIKGFFGIVVGGTGTLVQGNYIGTDVTGTVSMGNDQSNIIIDDAPSNTIGGTVNGARNIISDSKKAPGVLIRRGKAKGNLVQGNHIGTDVTGNVAMGNAGNGVSIVFGASNNTIGGAITGARNIISGNKLPGIFLGDSDIDGIGTSENQVQGNFIGTNAAGTQPVANFQAGIAVGGFLTVDPDRPVVAINNTIGGATAGAGNVISGNVGPGVLILNLGSRGNSLEGNYIGTDATGTKALPNSGSGVVITRAPDNTIGGTTVEARNIISGNEGHGIAIGIPQIDPFSGQRISGGTGIRVLGNFIGTDSTGITGLGNKLCGVFVDAFSVQNFIEGNLIAFNGTNGVCLPDNNNPAVRIAILNNAIHSNAQIGIDLGAPGPTPNPGNRLTGANNLQNFPDIDSASFVTSATDAGSLAVIAMIHVMGSLNAAANTTYTLQFFFGSDCSSGQGHQFTGAIPLLIGTSEVTTNGSGIAPYNLTLSFTLTDGMGGGFVNSTATDPVGNTSELSECRQVTGTGPATGPTITSACRGTGKQLIINGAGFVDGAKVLINGEVEKKTQFVSSNQVIAFKAGKRTFDGDKLKVRNPDSSEAPEFSYTRVNCPP